jgi:hypothetical protein
MQGIRACQNPLKRRDDFYPGENGQFNTLKFLFRGPFSPSRVKTAARMISFVLTLSLFSPG